MSAFPQVEGYQIIKNIGKGSTSTVYLAHVKEKTKNMVAIKVIERNKLSKSAEDAVVTEIGVMKKFKHKHIVQMIDFIWDRKNIYIILEHCDGGDLSTFIKQRKKLSEKVCRKFMQQLALALQFLRSHNVSHLDLKPQNLLLMRSPQLTLKVGDFGLANFMSEKTQMENIRGSPLYMAPEMLLHNRYDVKADLWSVGVIAYECIFGHAPYASDSIKDLCEKVKKVLPIEIPSNQVSPECRDLLLGLLKHNPSERMSYCQFFKHPFVDLDHMPTTESYAKGLEAIHQAVQLDSEKQYKAAFSKYCIGLQYLIPCSRNEPDKIKKEAFQIKLNEYIKRAEELKATLYVSKIKINEEKADNFSTSYDDDRYPTLTSLCQNTPQLANAVEIALSGQMYLVEGQYEAAFEKYKISLNLLEKLLEKEPPGIRYNLLIKQVTDWTSQCENAKSLLQAKDQKVNDQSIDVPDGFSSISKGKSDKKSPKLFRVVSRLVLRTNNRSSLSPEKK
ncbi:serine/threonine-protein kinase ULK3-like isoform X1 [Melanaphis sacchari]|uniref:serine/threonine-protein kinase ULK3-like isoform X1 n=1 Tax=Melanaphis sacchari TaxID=742174 RepID=UPI000DC12EE5|nr:serine/threonine-protein kinase ULK3-like isoform X1 [Melanaphis sacchari]XP_025209161.1 serine/threonine-protein kinase ULK3-like isoform X1 [Melanaphis sacchari]